MIFQSGHGHFHYFAVYLLFISTLDAVQSELLTRSVNKPHIIIE